MFNTYFPGTFLFTTKNLTGTSKEETIFALPPKKKGKESSYKKKQKKKRNKKESSYPQLKLLAAFRW